MSHADNGVELDTLEAKLKLTRLAFERLQHDLTNLKRCEVSGAINPATRLAILAAW